MTVTSGQFVKMEKDCASFTEAMFRKHDISDQQQALALATLLITEAEDIHRMIGGERFNIKVMKCRLGLAMDREAGEQEIISGGESP